MAGEGTNDADDDSCPLCGGPGLPAATRVTLAKRRLFPIDAVTATTTTLRADDARWSSAASLRESLRAVAADLDAERAAAADAATEAMSMILRLQRERSEAVMEARQYRRYAEERFAHDAAQVAALRDAVRAMSARLAECRARLLRLGYPLPSSPYSSDDDDQYCPSVPCLLDDHPSTTTSPAADVGTPRTHHLLNRMHRDEPSSFSDDALTFSYSYSPDAAPGADDDEYYHLHVTPLRDAPDQDDDDRVYTVDAVHPGIPTPSSSSSDDAAEIQKLKARLQALEADRESMRRAIFSAADEKAQVVLLREVAQHLCKQGAASFPVKVKVQQPRLQPVVAAPPRKLVNRRQPSFVKVFIVTVIKWIASIIRWRRKSNRIKHPIGLCGSNVGLMLVLDRYPKQRCRRFIKRI